MLHGMVDSLDPEVGRVLKSKGLIANADYSTEGELGLITSLDSTFKDNKVHY